MKRAIVLLVTALVAAPAFATVLDVAGPATPVTMLGSMPRTSVLYDNVPGTGETVFTTGSTPRTGGADEFLFAGTQALLTSMRFGYSIASGGPSAFDARIRIYDDIDFTAGTGVAQFGTLASEFTLALTGQSSGAWISGAVDLTPLAGGGVTLTDNAANIGAGVVDGYFQINFFQPGTTTPVASNAVTFIFDGTGVNTGYTFDSVELGGPGDSTGEVYWRDANANGIISGDEARSFAAPTRANFVLHFEGDVIPEPASFLLLGLAGLLRRR